MLQATAIRAVAEDYPIGGLPRRSVPEQGRLAHSGSVTHVEARSARTTGDYAEFSELAASVRRWLALTKARDALRTPPTDLRVLSDAVPESRWSAHEDVVAAGRPALLVDVEHMPSELLPHLLETVRAAYGNPVVSRAYADWTKPGLTSWFGALRQCGVQPIHNFDSRDHRRNLVALTLEALEIVDRYAITSLVLVGDLGAALPLVTKLKASGVKVVVIGPDSNPDDVRRVADEYLDVATLSDLAVAPARGRHQA